MSAAMPSGYTAGQVTIPAGTASNLGALISAQVDANAAEAVFQLKLSADAGNAGPIFIGMDNTVSAAKYGASIAAGANRDYGGGGQRDVPVGRIYVFSTADSVLHVEQVS